MSRPLLILVVVLVILVGGLFVLASRDGERTPTRVEKAVALENLA
jgi:hypothetical protein